MNPNPRFEIPAQRRFRWPWSDPNRPQWLWNVYNPTTKGDAYDNIARTLEEERYENLVFLVGQDGKAHSIGTKGANRYNYPFDASNVMRMEDFFGSHASNLRNNPMSVRRAWRFVGLFAQGVEKRSKAVRNIPYKIYRGKRVIYDSRDTAKRPRILHWMRGDKEMGYTSFNDLIKLTIEGLILDGRAAWGLDYHMGALKGIRWWSPDYWEPRYNEFYTKIEGVERQVGRDADMGNTRYLWPLECVGLFFDRDTYCESGPPELSVGRKAAIHASVLHGMDRFLNVHMQRGLLKATVILVPKGTRDEERKMFNTRFGRMTGGKKQRHITLEADSVDVKEIGEGLADLSSGTVERQQKESLLNALDVPHGLILSGDTNARGTKEELLYQFYQQTVMPDAARFADEVNAQVLEPMGLRMKFSVDRLDVMRKKRLEEAKQWQTLTKNKQIVSSKYARMELGIEAEDTFLEEELEKERQDKLDLMQNAPGGGDGGNKPDTQDPRQEVSRDENDSDRDRERKPESERENDDE